MKTIQDFLPKKSKDHALVQGRVPQAIADQARGLMHEKGWSWADVITSALKAFIANELEERRDRLGRTDEK